MTVQVATRYARTDTLITTHITYYLYTYVHKNKKYKLGSRNPPPPPAGFVFSGAHSIDRSIDRCVDDTCTQMVLKHPPLRAVRSSPFPVPDRRSDVAKAENIDASRRRRCALAGAARLSRASSPRATRRRSTGEAKGSKGKQRTRSPTRRTTRCARASRNRAPDRDGRWT